jgi:hypothetical protein
MISRTRWPVSFWLSTVTETPSTSAADFPIPVTSASLKTANWSVIPVFNASSNISRSANGALGAGSLNTSLITIASCPARSSPSG